MGVKIFPRPKGRWAEAKSIKTTSFVAASEGTKHGGRALAVFVPTRNSEADGEISEIIKGGPLNEGNPALLFVLEVTFHRFGLHDNPTFTTATFLPDIALFELEYTYLKLPPH